MQGSLAAARRMVADLMADDGVDGDLDVALPRSAPAARLLFCHRDFLP